MKLKDMLEVHHLERTGVVVRDVWRPAVMIKIGRTGDNFLCRLLCGTFPDSESDEKWMPMSERGRMWR